MSAWNSRHTLRPGQGSLAAWLVGITRHRIADVRAQRSGPTGTSTPPPYAVTEAFDPQDDCAERLRVSHELEQMGDPRGTVLRMAFIEDRPHEEMARHLDLPLGIVKSHVRRGLIQLRNRPKEVERVSS